MKKYIIFSLIASILLVSLISASQFNYKTYNLKVVQKDANWNVVENGQKANILLSHGVRTWLVNGKPKNMLEFRASAILLGLKPNTDYTLIYYGDVEFNDVWNHATCITHGVTNQGGNVRLPEGIFDYSNFINDGINQKFWIVKSEDLSCEDFKFKAWHPSEYLFETESI